MLPIIEKHNVDIYVTGHDHNLQHWATNTKHGIGMLLHLIYHDLKAIIPLHFLKILYNFGIDHLVIGAGGADLYRENNEYVEMNEKLGMKLKYFGEEFGFGYFSVDKSSLTVQYIGENGNVLYEYSKFK